MAYKRIQSAQHTYIIDEVDYYDPSVIYGFCMRQSIDVGVNTEMGGYSGFFYNFNDKPLRIVTRSKCIEIPMRDEDFIMVEDLLQRGVIGYSNRAAEKYNLVDIIRFYDVVSANITTGDGPV